MCIILDFPDLRSIQLGSNAFMNTKSVTFESQKMVNMIE